MQIDDGAESPTPATIVWLAAPNSLDTHDIHQLLDYVLDALRANLIAELLRRGIVPSASRPTLN